MMLLGVLATVLLGMAIVLLGGTIVVYLKAACTNPTRVREIRRLRQAGLLAHQDEA